MLDALLPKYVDARHLRLRCCEAAASELGGPAAGDEVGHRQRRTSSSRSYTRQANQARQAEITQEISEIVGGADALADASRK